MLKVRELADTPKLAVLAITLALGSVLILIVRRFGVPVAFLSLLLIPLFVFILPTALRQAIGLISALRARLAWWHALWLLIFLSEQTFRIRSSEAIKEAPMDTLAAYRVALVGIVAFVLGVRLVLRRTAWVGSLFRGLPGVLSAYALICVASTAWSAYPAWTLYKSLEYGVDVALVAAIVATVASAEVYRTLFDWTWGLYILLLFSVWVGVLVWPTEALQPSAGLIRTQLYGVVPAIAAVGELAAVLATVALARLLSRCGDERNGAFYLFLLLSSLVTLVLSQERSAIAGLLLGVALLLLFTRHVALLVSAIAASLAVLASNAGGLLGEYFRRGQSPELFASLSGRVGWWEFAWQEFLKNPLTGLGAYTARFEVLAKVGESDTSTMHNTFVEVVVGTSFWGLVPVLVVLFATWWVLIRCLRNYPRSSPEREMALEAVGVLAVVSVRSVFTTHLILHTSLSFLLIVGCAELLRRQWNQRRPTGVRIPTVIRR
jgi:O-antigen ligase